MTTSPVLAACMNPFATAAAYAALFELRVRLLADRDPATQAVAFKDLSVVVKELVSHFGDGLEKENAEKLTACAQLRNKLFHLELSRVSGRVVTLGEEINRGGVWQLDLATSSVQETKDTSTQTGRIYGWLWESATSGAFVAAAKIFQEAGELVERLSLAPYDGEKEPTAPSEAVPPTSAP